MASDVGRVDRRVSRQDESVVLGQREDRRDLLKRLGPALPGKHDPLCHAAQPYHIGRLGLSLQRYRVAEFGRESRRKLRTGVGGVGEHRRREPAAAVDAGKGRPVGGDRDRPDVVLCGHCLEGGDQPRGGLLDGLDLHAVLLVLVEGVVDRVHELQAVVEDQKLLVGFADVEDGNRFGVGSRGVGIRGHSVSPCNRQRPCGAAFRRGRAAGRDRVSPAIPRESRRAQAQ